ncbi:MAG: YbdK family carboxylate-amine ligase [Thermoleophilia bacterium]|nr:YbdK family carboxylate-amine ligase [Thermoleophilia bacterium]
MTPPPATSLDHDGPPEPSFDEQLDGARDRYDASVDGTLGVEEEFAICTPGSLDLVSRYEDLRVLADNAGLENAVAGELLASEIEFRTGRCESWAGAAEELTDIRRRVMDVAQAANTVLGASATHPWADYREQTTVDLPYYNQLVDRMQYAAHRNNTFGLHVHVGVAGCDRAVRVADALRAIQPMLLALSASSPFLDGRDTGLASVRHMIFSRNFIRGNVAPIFGSLDGYLGHLRWLRDVGSIKTVGQVWWGTRPHVLHGTVELRMFDGQPDVRDTLALTALASGTVAHLCALDDAGELPAPVASHLIDENCWRAARWGTDARFADLTGTGVTCADEAIGRLIADARAAGRAAGRDLDAGLDRAQELLHLGCSALRQRAIVADGGTLVDAYRSVVDQTMSSAAVAAE